jgi:hypothetical protein
MGKSAPQADETAADKAAADVANQQWDLYNTELKPYEDTFMNKVEGLNSDNSMSKAAGTAGLATQHSFSKARGQMADSLAAGGVDPTSGKYQGAAKNMETNQALSQTDTTNRAQSSQQDKYVAGLKDIMSIGAGQKAEALSGMGDVAGASVSKSINDANTAFQDDMAWQNLAGEGAGAAGLAYGLKPTTDTKSLVDSKSPGNNFTNFQAA